MSANVLPTGTAPQPTNNHLSPSPLMPSRSSADSHLSEPGTSSVSTSTSSSISGSTSQHHTTSDNTSPSSQSSRLSVEGCIAPQDPQASLPSHHNQHRQRRLSAARDGTPLPDGQEPERLPDNREQRAVSLTPKDKPLPPQPQGPPSSIGTGAAHDGTAHLTANSVHPQERHRQSFDRSASGEHEMELPRIPAEQPPPYSFTVGNHGSTLMVATGPPSPSEDHVFQIQELTPPVSGSGSSPIQHQFVCANPMHDQQYLLVGSGNALHSVDLTLPADKQAVRAHIQGIGFKEIHCLEDIGLVIVIAGRNSRVRCYDYDSIKRLISYGYSKEGQGRVVEGGKLGVVKNMIQLRVETAFQNNDSQGPSGSPKTSPGNNSTTTNRIMKGSQPQGHHRRSTSIDRSMLSPESPGPNVDLKSIGEDDHDVSTTLLPTAVESAITPSSPPPVTKKQRQRPMSFGGLASLAHERVMGTKGQPLQPVPSPTSTPASPNNSNTATKNKRFSQMATYLSQAAVSTGAVIVQDAPSEEAVLWAWDFTKLKQTKDVLSLDFHYTATTIFMTVLSKNGIDIYCRPKAARGRRPPPSGTIPSGSTTNVTGSGSSRPSGSGGRKTGSEAPGRQSTSSLGGMATSPGGCDGGMDIYEWKQVKQFYHPEAPSFMTVVKSPQEVTDIILCKGPRACIVNVETMSVTEIQRQESGGVLMGISKKLGFKNFPPWHSFDKIPFDVPPHILYPEAAAAVYSSRGDSKELYSGYGSEQRDQRHSAYMDSYSIMSDAGRRSHDDIIQKPADQQSIHQEQMEEQERAEAETLVWKLQQAQIHDLQAPKTHGQSSGVSSSSSSSSNLSQLPPTMQGTSSGGQSKSSKKTRMVTSEEVLNKAYSQRTAFHLYLATSGSQSRIVDLQGRSQSPVVLDWGSAPPQKVEFLQTPQDIYVVGLEKSSIVIFSLLRARKIKEILKKDLILATDAALASAAAQSSSLPHSAALSATSHPTTYSSNPDANQYYLYDSPTLSSVMTGTYSGIKFLGRDNIADDSLCIFFSYTHPRNGTTICKLGIFPPQTDLELIGYYP
ncbi:hypothetical protein BGX31_005146 [Mortierella sp. GBA43]|nr:hypothetical protein BGX31_005146 [Mortierella sp. GBA43]